MRKRLAEKLFSEHGYTQQRIAAVLGVSRVTITNDLANLSPPDKLKQHAKTNTNPKGAGDLAFISPNKR